jgi:hypothetical protein
MAYQLPDSAHACDAHDDGVGTWSQRQGLRYCHHSYLELHVSRRVTREGKDFGVPDPLFFITGAAPLMQGRKSDIRPDRA